MRHIICANISLRDKLHILRTMVDVLDIDKAKYDKLLRRVGKRAASRNTVAHDQFQPNDEGNGVRFVIVKAKGLYGTPSVVWTEKRFEQEGCLLDGIKAQLIEFNEVMGNHRSKIRQRFQSLLGYPLQIGPCPCDAHSRQRSTISRASHFQFFLLKSLRSEMIDRPVTRGSCRSPQGDNSPLKGAGDSKKLRQLIQRLGAKSLSTR